MQQETLQLVEKQSRMIDYNLTAKILTGHRTLVLPRPSIAPETLLVKFGCHLGVSQLHGRFTEESINERCCRAEVE